MKKLFMYYAMCVMLLLASCDKAEINSASEEPQIPDETESITSFKYKGIKYDQNTEKNITSILEKINKNQTLATYIGPEGDIEYFDNYEELLSNISRIEKEEIENTPKTRAGMWYKTTGATLKAYNNHLYLTNDDWFATTIRSGIGGPDQIAIGINEIGNLKNRENLIVYRGTEFTSFNGTGYNFYKTLSSWELICSYQLVSTQFQVYPRPYVTFSDETGKSITYGVDVVKVPYGYVKQMAKQKWNDRATAVRLFYSNFDVPCN